MIISLFKTLRKVKHRHFISVDYKTYKKWKYIIKLAVFLNKKYISCEIYRKNFKNLNNFVVIGLRYYGKNVNRRTNGYAKNYIKVHDNEKCLYCNKRLTNKNVTVDHIVPISKGGNNTQVNMIVCCKKCNNERGDMSYKNYMKSKGLDYKKYI